MGAVVDVEFSRLSQLRKGVAADEELQYPVRDDTLFARRELSNFRDLVHAQQIRIQHGGDPLESVDGSMLPQHKSHHRLIFAAGAATAAWLGMRHLIRKHEASADPAAASDQQDETAHR